VVHVPVSLHRSTRCPYGFCQPEKLAPLCTWAPKAFSRHKAFSSISFQAPCATMYQCYHMPPAALDRSKTVTFRPSFFICAAAATPLMPAPITATHFVGLVILNICYERRGCSCCPDAKLLSCDGGIVRLETSVDFGPNVKRHSDCDTM
jgi:hypothetical protein